MICSLTLPRREIEPLAILVRHPELSLHLDAKSPALVVLHGYIVAFPTVVQQTNLRFWYGCAGLRLQLSDGNWSHLKPGFKEMRCAFGQGLAELQQLLQALTLQPGPLALEPHLVAIVISLVPNRFDGFLREDVIRRLASCHATRIRTVGGHI